MFWEMLELQRILFQFQTTVIYPFKWTTPTEICKGPRPSFPAVDTTTMSHGLLRWALLYASFGIKNQCMYPDCWKMCYRLKCMLLCTGLVFNSTCVPPWVKLFRWAHDLTHSGQVQLRATEGLGAYAEFMVDHSWVVRIYTLNMISFHYQLL